MKENSTRNLSFMVDRGALSLVKQTNVLAAQDTFILLKIIESSNKILFI